MPDRMPVSSVTEAGEPDALSLWPGPHDALFVKNVEHQPTLGASATGPGWFEYIESYRDAARALVDIAVSDDHDRMPMPHLAGIPVLFLYRHYMELVMKELLLQGAWHQGQSPTPDELATRYLHDLLKLWQPCQETVDAIWPDANDRRRKKLKSLTGQVEELATIDPHSFVARYPMTRGGTESLPAYQFESYDLSGSPTVSSGSGTSLAE